MKKVIVIGVIALFIAVSFAPSINANVSRLPVKSKLVETAVRIHRANGITPYTVKLTEKESDEVDRIFDNLKVSLDSAKTGEEIDEIYDDAVESLYELGMFPRMTLKEAKQLVKGNSIKSQSGNIGTGDENFDCMVVGRTTETFIFDLDKPFWNKFLEGIRLWFGSMWGWGRFNLYHYNGKIGKISFSSETWDSGDHYVYPSNGWVWTDGSNGVVEWEGEFYGNIETRLVYEWPRNNIEQSVYIGVADFEGLWIGRIISFNPVFLLGNAEHVKITYSSPW